MPSYLIVLHGGYETKGVSGSCEDLCHDLATAHETWHTSTLNANCIKLHVRERLPKQIKDAIKESKVVEGLYLQDDDDIDPCENTQPESSQEALAVPEVLDPHPESPLLSLPPEIRNRIYRAVLVDEEGPIYVKPDEKLPAAPGLLQTCRVIRKEAITIYYQENRFVFDVEDFDVSEYVEWFRTKRQYHPETCLEMDPSTNWENLLVWLKVFFQKGIPRPAPGFTTDKSEWSSIDVASMIFEMVATKRSAPGTRWAEVVDMLENVHKILCFYEASWEVNAD